MSTIYHAYINSIIIYYINSIIIYYINVIIVCILLVFVCIPEQSVSECALTKLMAVIQYKAWKTKQFPVPLYKVSTHARVVLCCSTTGQHQDYLPEFVRDL